MEKSLSEIDKIRNQLKRLEADPKVPTRKLLRALVTPEHIQLFLDNIESLVTANKDLADTITQLNLDLSLQKEIIRKQETTITNLKEFPKKIKTELAHIIEHENGMFSVQDSPGLKEIMENLSDEKIRSPYDPSPFLS